jgi:hypothetical protein
MNLYFILSLPERVIRAISVGLGGFVYEVAEILLPDWLRGTRLYRAIVGGLLRISIELVGGAKDILPYDEVGVGELAVRKAAGTGIEFLGLLTMGWSPLWLFAVVADLTGGTRVYLRELVSELKGAEMLPVDADVASVEGLLNALESSSGVVAESLDVPPLSVGNLQDSWQKLRTSTAEMPNPEVLASIYDQMQKLSKRENTSLGSISTLMAASAARAGVRVGQMYIFDYYQNTLRRINKEGLQIYSMRVFIPYLMVARGHFDPRQLTYTERMVKFIRRETHETEEEVSNKD